MATVGKVKGRLSNLSICASRGEVSLLMKKCFQLLCSVRAVAAFLSAARQN